MNDLPVKIRSIGNDDTYHGIIVETWANAVYFGLPSYLQPSGDAINKLKRIVRRLLITYPDLFSIVVNEEDDNQTFGWVCKSPGVVHFVYVKKEFRLNGLATMLIGYPRRRWVFSNWTKGSMYIGGITYKPSLFLEVLDGLDQTVERDISSNNQSVIKISANNTHHRRGYTENSAVRVDS